MMLVDVHCHLQYFDESSIQGIIERAIMKNTLAIINNGTDMKSNQETLLLSARYPVVKSALGLYPVDAVKQSEQQIEEDIEFIEKNRSKIIAVGEIGLDYHWIKNPEEQKKERDAFERLIALSEKIKKPVIVHSRMAEQDTVKILTSSKLKNIVLHCFNGNLELAKKALDLGFYFSIPANIIYSEHFKKLSKLIPLSHILTETDAPYLSPYKGKKNEPSFIIETIKKLSEIKKMDAEEVSRVIYKNYQTVFL